MLKLKTLLIFKLNVIAIALTYLFAFLSPIKWFMIAVGFFVVADLVTGILAAKKSGKKIESKKMFRTIPKYIAYSIAIIAAHALELLFFQDFPATKMVSGLIAFIEIKSLDENLEKITGHSLFGAIIDKLNPKKDQEDDNDKSDTDAEGK
jgi:phage-related holin